MAGFINGLVPADIDPNAINLYAVGELIIDRSAVDERGKLIPTMYVALTNPDTNKKELYLVAGAGKYELVEHLARAHVIGNTAPTNFDKSTLWFNTQMVYVEPSDVTKSYITIRTETSPGVWEWRKILPYTSMESVIIGKDGGNTVTLANLIRNNRVLYPVPTSLLEASYGELYVNDANELYYKMGPNPQDQHLVGTLSSYLRERVIEQIKVGQTQPLNFNYNTTWFTDDGDVSLAKSKYIRFTDPSKTTGLKFERDAQNKMKSAATLENENKSVIIDNNSTTDYGHIWLNFPVNADGKYYLELYVEDVHNAAQIMLLADGVTQPTLNNYGTQVDNSQALITTTKSVFGGVSVNKAFPMNRKTIFIEITKSNQSCKIDLGYVTDSGVKNYVYGDGGTNTGFNMNLARIAVGSSVSYEANSYTRFSILPFLIKKIPTGFTGINNTLPGESPFNVHAIATNVQSVFVNSTATLSNLMENGRIIPVFRDYADKDNARINELILDSDRSKLFTMTRDGRVVPIAGALDDSIEDHIMNSLKVVSDDVASLTKLSSDPRRIYVSKKTTLPTDPNRIIAGNLSVVDNSPEGDDETYKMIIPRSLSTLIGHNWIDNNNIAKSGNLKTYLDDLDTTIKNAISKDNTYSGYEELNFKKSDLINTYNTQPSFIQELAKRMLTNSLYMETVAKIPASGTSSNQIDNFFNVPEDGIVYTYADSNDHVYSTLLTKNAIYYKTFYKPAYDGSGPWRKVITDLNGTATVNNLSGENLTANVKVEARDNVTTPSVKLSGLTGSITANNKNITNNSANLLSYEGSSILDTLAYSIGDKKFKSAKIISKLRPVWTDELGTEYPWLTTEDIRNSWNYKGTLNPNGSLIDLDTISANTDTGYYNVNTPVGSGYNFPETKLTGILQNYILDGMKYQMFIGKGDNGHRIFLRNYENSTWGKWSYLANNLDLDKKLSLTGGTVTGPVKINGLLTGTESRFTTVSTNKLASTENNYSILTTSTNNLTIGDGRYNTINVTAINVPTYSNGTTTQKFVLESDLSQLNNDLLTLYYTKAKTNELLAEKVNVASYTTDMKGKVNRSGDTMLGTLTMSAGDVKVQNGAVEIAGDSKLILPGETSDSNILYNKIDLAKFSRNVRYDTIKLSSDNETAVLTISGGNSLVATTNTPTSIRFYVDKKGNLSVGNILNRTVVNATRQVLMKDEIVDAYTGGTDKVLSAERGKELSEATIGRNRGNLFDAIGVGSVYNDTNLTSLHAGYYYVTTKNEIKAIGLDESIITGTTGLLFVEGSLGSTGRAYRFITRILGTETFVMAVRIVDGSTSKWRYILDKDSYYTRSEIDAMLTDLENRVLKRIISSQYTFTGYSSNNTVPRKLIHTHNHEALGDSDTLYFKTNINSVSATDGKNFVIELDGFASGSALDSLSSPIKVFISGRVENNTLSLVNIINTIPGSSINVENVKLTTDGFVVFVVKDKVSNRRLSFDTYMRFSSITDTTFEGAITQYKTTEIL